MGADDMISKQVPSVGARVAMMSTVAMSEKPSMMLGIVEQRALSPQPATTIKYCNINSVH